MNIIPNKEFKYFLTYEGVRTELVFAPTDYDDDSIGKYKRDMKYGGVLRTYTDSITFSLDGYKILKAAYLKYGYVAEVIFEVETLDHSNYSYKPLFTSNVNFAEWNDTGLEATVKLLSSGLWEKLLAKETTDFEYLLSGSDVVNVILPGVAFSEKADWITPQQVNPIRNDYIPELSLVQNDTAVGFLTVQNTSNEEDPVLSTSTNWFARAERNLSTRIKGNLQGIAVKNLLQSSTLFNIEVVNQSGSLRYLVGIVQAINFGGTPFNYDFDVNLNLSDDEKLFLRVRKVNGSPGANNNYLTFNSDGEFFISYNSVSDPSNCKAIKIYDLYKRIINRIDPTVDVDSYLLKSTWIKDLLITSGNGIRELAGATININFKDFFDSCNGWESVGFGFDSDKWRIEQLPFFFRPVPVLSDQLDISGRPNFSTAIDLIFSSLQVGYNDGNTDNTDGQFEYNSGQQWAMPQSAIPREENWKSPIRADQYGIEKLRRDFIKKTNDTSSDNDTFAVHCYQDGDNWRPILGSSYVSVSGMASQLGNETAYNLALTPKENLIRHKTYLASIFIKLQNRFIEFASAEKNKELEFVRPGNPNFRLKQDESISVASLGEPYFMPVYATINAKLPVDFMRKVDLTGGFGYISFNYDNQVYKGFIIEASQDLKSNEERELKLLLTSDNYY